MFEIWRASDKEKKLIQTMKKNENAKCQRLKIFFKVYIFVLNMKLSKNVDQ